MRMKGIVRQVLSGDSFLIVGGATDENGCAISKKLILSGIECPRLFQFKGQVTTAKDEPLSFEAREFTRQWLIGQVVDFDILDSVGDLDFCVSMFQNKDVATELLSRGLAKIKNGNISKQNESRRAQWTSAQQSATENKIGIWADELPESFEWRHATGDIFYCKNFVETYKAQKLHGCVEYVRDGSCVKVLFPQLKSTVQILFTGVACSALKRTADGKVIADKAAFPAKEFVEARLLQRDVDVRIEGADKFGNVFGSIYHPNGFISEIILQKGFGKVSDLSISYSEDYERLWNAQKKAQDAKLGIWEKFLQTDNQSSYSKQTDSEIHQEVILKKEYEARVIEITSGDAISIFPFDDEGESRSLVDNPNGERKVYLASIRAPKMKTRTRDAEPYAHEAFEFLRKELAGKKIKVILEYTRSTASMVPAGGDPSSMTFLSSDEMSRMHFVTIWYDQGYSKCINVMMVAAGWAKPSARRQDDERSSNYPDILLAADLSEQKKTGMNKGGDAPTHRWNDLVGPANNKKAKALEASFKKMGEVDGVVGHVFNGGRFRVDIPKENCSMSFILSGVRVPQTSRLTNDVATEAEPFAAQSLSFAKWNWLHKKMKIKIELCDKGGNFIGSMSTADDRKEDAAIALVKNGWAKTTGYSNRGIAYIKEVEQAEKNALDKTLGLWAYPDNVTEYFESREQTRPDGDYTENTDVPSSFGLSLSSPAELSRRSTAVSPVEVLEDCYVGQVNGINEFFVVCNNSSLDRISDECQKSGSDSTIFTFNEKSEVPKNGELILAMFSDDHLWYRGRVFSAVSTDISATSVDEERYHVLYIDYGNSEIVSTDRMKTIPECINGLAYPPQALPCALSGIKTLTGNPEEANGLFADIGKDLQGRMIVLESKVPSTPTSTLTSRNKSKPTSPWGGNPAKGTSGGPTIRYGLFIPSVPLPPLMVSSAVISAAPPPSIESGCSVNAYLLKAGVVKINTRSFTGEYTKVLSAAEQEARRSYVGIWRYGDVGDSDEDLEGDVGGRKLKPFAPPAPRQWKKT